MRPPEPIRFALSEDEARIAGSRAALRTALADGLLKRHVAPLVAFVLFMGFVALLALLDFLSWRVAEIFIIFSAAAFMAQRLITRRRFWLVRKAAIAEALEIAQAGQIIASFDAHGLSFEAAEFSRRWRLGDALEYEDAGGMIYWWTKSGGGPAYWPTRAFADEAQAERWRDFARERIAVRQVAPALLEDDD